MRIIHWVFLGVALLALATACRPPTAEPLAPSLAGTEWVLVSLDGGVPLDGTRITLGFGELEAGGYTGCNHYGTEYQASATGTLEIGEAWRELEACLEPEGVMAQERAYMDALLEIARYHVEAGEGRLTLSPADGGTLLVFERREALQMDPPELAGTRWSLVSIADHAPLPDAPITLVFHDTRTYAGHGGCRGYVGGYTATGAAFQIYWMAAMGTEPCLDRTEALDQEGAYTTALGDATRYRLTDGRLELETEGGDLLVYEQLSHESDLPLLGTEWVLLATLERAAPMAEDKPRWMPRDVIVGTAITSIWEADAVSGSAGCNQYSASYTLDGGALVVGPAVATEMACLEPEGRMAQEQGFLSALSSATSLRVDGLQLWLESGDGRALLFAARESD